ncbi:MAG: GNAT family N-acetyltransferase [Arenibacter algicola]
MRIQKIDLFADLFEKENGLPEIFAGMEIDQKNIFTNSSSIKENFSPVYSLKFVPDYMVFPLVSESLFHCRKLVHVKGYSIKLDDVTDINSYVKSQFRSNAKTIHRYVNRLESCFNIEYKMFYGQIDKDTYNFIMDSLFDMMQKRFSQLQIKNESEAKWEHTRTILYDLILKKRASLFVIYSGSKPIEISINYHFKGILFSSISSYDIDYSKFGLGHVEIVKQLEWCLANNHKIFEMGRGDLDYKRRWSNQIYNFEHHIVYLKDSFYGRLWSIKEVGLNRLKAYLKSKNIDLIFKNIKGKLSPKYDKNGYIEYKVETLNTNFSEINIPPIDLNQEAHAHLKKYVYDFLYSNIVHISQIKIFCLEEGKAYIIKGEKTSVKIYLEN